MEEKLNRVQRCIVRFVLLVLLVTFTFALYQSCSVAFVKGSHNQVHDIENVDASGENVDVLDRSRGSRAVQIKDTIDDSTFIVKDTIIND